MRIFYTFVTVVFMHLTLTLSSLYFLCWEVCKIYLFITFVLKRTMGLYKYSFTFFFSYRPFGQCAEVLTAHTVQKFFMPVVVRLFLLIYLKLLSFISTFNSINCLFLAPHPQSVKD